MQKRMGIIGLGVIGRRMLGMLQGHDRLTAARGWDPSPEAMLGARQLFPSLELADGPGEVIDAGDVDVVYVACPPAHHREYALAAMWAEKAIFCEKPLGVDLQESRDLVRQIEDSGLPSAVNYVHASAKSTTVMSEAVRTGALGEPVSADLQIHFCQWPRDWQVNADWLRFREQGGFVREVISHFVFLTERLFGKSTIAYANPTYPVEPELCEVGFQGALDCEDVRLVISATTGGVGPDTVRYTVRGSQRSFLLDDWHTLYESDGGDWQPALPDIEDHRVHSRDRQIGQLADLLDDRPHNLADFQEALSVQELIEPMLGEG